MKIFTLGFTKKTTQSLPALQRRKPHHCHRRLVAEYLQQHSPGVEIEHLG